MKTRKGKALEVLDDRILRARFRRVEAWQNLGEYLPVAKDEHGERRNDVESAAGDDRIIVRPIPEFARQYW